MMGSKAVKNIFIVSVYTFIALGCYAAYMNQQVEAEILQMRELATQHRDISTEILDDLSAYILDLQEDIDALKAELEACWERSVCVDPARVTVTCYNSEPRQTDSTPFITAFNWTVRPGIIAVSTDLLERGYVPGSKVYLKNFGVFTVGDIMHDRFTKRVDIWIPKNKQVFKKTNVLMVPVTEQVKNTCKECV